MLDPDSMHKGEASSRARQIPRAEKYSKAQAFLRDAIAYDGDECVLWPFSRDSWGYGRVKFLGRCVAPHRVVCSMNYGKPPTEEHQAAHSCGNGHLGCVTPSHLSWKTPAENTADQLVHGTRNIGERNGSHHLTAEEVLQIRELCKTQTQNSVARQFGISSGHVSSIVNRRIWRHV